MPSPPSRDWRSPDGAEYRIWWGQHDKYGLGVLLTFVNSPSRQYRVMYRGPALSAMSEDVIRLCYRVAQGTGFVWIDSRTGVAWHVGTRVMLEESSGRVLSANVPQATAPLWEYTDDRLRRVAQEATEIRGSDRSRELWR